MMRIIGKIDDWLLARHQAAADWAYTLWDVSPYQIAAQCFGAFACLVVRREGLMLMGEARQERAVFVRLLIFPVFMGAIYSRISLQAHRDWLSGRLPFNVMLFSTPRIVCSMMFWLAALTAVLALSAASTALMAVADTISIILNLAAISGFYFLACVGPTKRQRREAREQLPALEPAS